MEKQTLLNWLGAWENLNFIILEMQAHPEHYAVLVDIALYSPHPNSWRAAYLLDKMNDLDAQLLTPWLDEMIQQVQQETHGGKKRHFLKLISLHEIPEIQCGHLFNFCQGVFTHAKEATAVRVHAMQILFNISEKEPGIRQELLALIQHEMEHHPTAGILARGRRLCNKLRRHIHHNL